MHVVTRKHLKEAEEEYPDAAREIAAWFRIAKDCTMAKLPARPAGFP